MHLRENPQVQFQTVITGDVVTRMARLFRAGYYPHVDREFTADDIAVIASNSGAVPIMVEHVRTPLQLGYVSDYSAVGEELWGTLNFTPEAWDLVVSSGARWLSVGIEGSGDDMRLFEVSIVSSPACPGAMMFSVDSSEEGSCMEKNIATKEAKDVRDVREAAVEQPEAAGFLSQIASLFTRKESDELAQFRSEMESVRKAKEELERELERVRQAAFEARLEALRSKFDKCPPAILEKAKPLLDRVVFADGTDARPAVVELLEEIAAVSATLFSEHAQGSDGREPVLDEKSRKILEGFKLSLDKLNKE